MSTLPVVEQRTKTLPVMEVFGGTIQGEGALAGLPTYFVRFGGCDYLCSWCDSLYAVLPAEVRAHAEKLTFREIIERVEALPPGPEWVTLSGGNPALHELADLTRALQDRGYRVAVETQGSRWRDWLRLVDCLTVSPKPPSSGMVTLGHDAETQRFMERATAERAWLSADDPNPDALKIVVFDDTDLEWACDFFARWPSWPLFLSAGTDPPNPGESPDVTLARLADRYRWLCEAAAGRSDFARARVLPQLHVVAHGHARGV